MITRLHQERPDFRETTIFQLDSADYHCSKVTRNFIANNGLQVTLGGVYGYRLAACEMLFAGIKSVNLNPQYEATGKR